MTATAPQPRRRGMTLLELMLALAGTALIGAAVAGMLTAVSYGTDADKDLRALVVRNQVLAGRISAAIRGSDDLLAAGDGLLVLWVEDTNDDGLPSAAELRRIERDPATRRVLVYDPTDAAADTVYALDDDFAAATAVLIAEGGMTATVWGTEVTGWAVSLDDPDPRAAVLVTHTLELTEGDLADTRVFTAANRN